jgi:hypothetical protein
VNVDIDRWWTHARALGQEGECPLYCILADHWRRARHDAQARLVAGPHVQDAHAQVQLDGNAKRVEPAAEIRHRPWNVDFVEPGEPRLV